MQAPRGVSAAKGVVVSQHYSASQAGAEILQAGGTAVDAAVTTAFALGVVEPWMSGPGGVGYLLIGRPGEHPVAVDFSTFAPAGLRVDSYPVVDGDSRDLFPWPRVIEDRNTLGMLSICPPTFAPGLELAWSRYGQMPWQDLLAPACNMAKEGLLIDWPTQLMIGSAAADLQSDADSAALFLDTNGAGIATDWTAQSDIHLPLTTLANTLETVARDGAGTLVTGDLAQVLISDIRDKGGVLTQADLEAAPPQFVAPTEITLPGGKRLWSAPDLSGGPAVIAMLKQWSNAGAKLSDGDLLAWRAHKAIDVLQERLSAVGDGAEHPRHPSCTTGFCVVDQNGLSVAATLTLVSIFGSKLLSPGTGILLNNAISWFDPTLGKPNSIGPGKRPLSNMAPTLIDNGRGRLTALSAAGGQRIGPAIAQVAAGITLDGMDTGSALGEPRLNIRADGKIVADTRISPEILEKIGKIGELSMVHPTVFPYYFAILSAAEFDGPGNITGFYEPFCPNADVATQN